MTTPPDHVTVYVSIGNSDDKLTQQQWAAFVSDFGICMRLHASEIYGEWYSLPDAPYQNACMAVAVNPQVVDALRDQLTQIRKHFNQDSIAWAQVRGTDFI